MYYRHEIRPPCFDAWFWTLRDARAQRSAVTRSAAARACNTKPMKYVFGPPSPPPAPFSPPIEGVSAHPPLSKLPHLVDAAISEVRLHMYLSLIHI